MPRAPNIRALRDDEIRCTLAERLVGVVDSARQIYTDLGLRPRRVFLVWVRFKADEDDDGIVGGDERFVDESTIGAGRAELVRELELLPTPKVSYAGLMQDLDSVGVTERGGCTVSEISASYSEDMLNGLGFCDLLGPDGGLLPGIQFFWEVRDNRPGNFVNEGTVGGEMPACQPQARRKFVPESAPNRSASGYEWTMSLARADGERGRNGELDGLQPWDRDDDE